MLRISVPDLAHWQASAVRISSFRLLRLLPVVLPHCHHLRTDSSHVLLADATCGLCDGGVAPDGRRLQNGMQCDLQFFTDDAQLVDTKCCDDGVSCAAGIPTKCDAKCALTYVPFFDRCSAILATQVPAQSMASYQRLYTTCATGLEIEPLLRAAAACSTPPPAPPHIGEDECASNPCQNGGECFDGANEYACVCPDSHHGLNCESVVPPPPAPPGAAIWILGEESVNCDDTCAGIGRGCTDGDWGVHDEASFVTALLNAAQDVDTRCPGGFAGLDRPIGHPPDRGRLAHGLRGGPGHAAAAGRHRRSLGTPTARSALRWPMGPAHQRGRSARDRLPDPLGSLDLNLLVRPHPPSGPSTP